MGANQSSQKSANSGFFTKTGVSSYEPVAPEIIARYYIAHEDMTPYHHDLAKRGLITQVELYKLEAGAYVPANNFFQYIGTPSALAHQSITEFWKGVAHEKIAAIFAMHGVSAPETSGIIDTLIAQVAKQGFEAVPNGDVPRETILRIIASIPSVPQSTHEEITAYVRQSYRELHERVFPAGKGVVGSAPHGESRGVLARGIYGRLVSKITGVSGSGPEDGMTAVKSAVLERLAQDKKKLVEHLLGVFAKMPYKELAEISGTPEERVRKIADWLAKRNVTNAQSVCTTFAEAINKEFGVIVVDPHLPADVCITQLDELLRALSHGVSADFFLIGIDIGRDIANLSKLVHALKIWRNSMVEMAQRDRAALVAREQLAPLDAIISEFERYIMLMKLAMNQHYEGTVTGLLASTTGRKSDVLSERIQGIMRGLVSTASQALVVSDALDKIGMSVEEFRNIKDGRELAKRFAELLTDEKINKDEDFDHFEAINVIFRAMGQGEKFADAVADARKRKGGISGSHYGGAPKYQPEQLVLKTYDLRKKRLNLVMNTYGSAVQGGLKKIREAIDNLSTAIGGEIPIGNTLANFIDLLRQLIDIKLEQPKIHLALLGYYRDAASAELRDRMLGTLKSVANYADFVAQDAQYAKSAHYFNAVRSAINEFMTAIDQSADSIKSMITGGEIDIADTQDKTGGDAEEAGPFRTSIRDLVVRDKLHLVDAVEKADYMMRVAQIKSNLTSSIENFKADTETYDVKVLGPAVAARLDKIREGKKYVMSVLEKDPDTAGTAFAPSALSKNSHQVYDSLKCGPAASDKPDDTQRRARTKKFFEEYYGAMEGFWESAQAIELYLKYFTNALVTNPAAIGDIAMMIREVDVITEMYNETSGNVIAAIFEKNFPGEKNLDSHLTIGAAAAGAAAPTFPAPRDIKESDPYFAWQNVGAYPFTNVLKDRLGIMLNEAQRGLEQYAALKNLVSFFVHFGSQIGGAELRRMSLRTPTEIYRGLTRFLAASAFATGFRRNTDTANATNVSAVKYTKTTGEIELTSKANADDSASVDYDPVTKASMTAKGELPPGGSGDATQDDYGCGRVREMSNCVFMRPAQQTISANNMSLYDDKTALDLAVENQTFAAIIKALGAKILVLSGTFDLIERPHEIHESRASVRMILGAGPEEEAPKVQDNTTELYVRLPLLALFYKTRFYDKKNALPTYMKDTSRIVLLPDLSGSVFSDFINHMFKRFPHVASQFFTDNEMRVIIAEINKIYANLAPKYPQDTCRAILQEFATVMSRMMYIIGEEDYNKYEEQRRMDTGFRNAYEQGEIVDYDILGDESFMDETFKRPLPSDAAANVGAQLPPAAINKDYIVRPEHWSLVSKFRCIIDKVLASPSVASLRGSIVAAQVKLAQTTDANERFRIVCGLIRGTGGVTTIDNLRRMIFLEVMGTGLGILSAIYTTIRHFQLAVAISNPRIVTEQLLRVEASGGVADDTLLTPWIEKVLDSLNIADDNFQKAAKEILAMSAGTLSVKKGSYEFTSYSGAKKSMSKKDAKVNFGPKDLDFNTPADRNVIQQHLLYYPAAMGILLESIATMMSNTHELVRVEIAQRDLLIDFGNLQNYVKKFLATLGTFVERMRPHIDPEIVRKYTNKMTPGSLYWLQEQFIEKLTEGRRAGATGSDSAEYSTLTHLSAWAKEAFTLLTSPITHDLNGKPLSTPFYTNYAQTLSGLVAFNGNHFIAPQGQQLFGMADVLANPFDAVLIRGTAGEKTVDTRFLCSLMMTKDPAVYDEPNNSILFSFNKLLAMFLRQMYDTSTGKIFSGLINTFAQGAFNSAILDTRNTFPDHLAHYYVESGKLGKIRTRGDTAISPDTNSDVNEHMLLDYLRTLEGADFGADAFGFTGANGVVKQFSQTPNKDAYHIFVVNAGLHKFVSGLLLAWYAHTSDLLSENYTIQGTDKVLANCMQHESVQNVLRAIHYTGDAANVRKICGDYLSAVLNLFRDSRKLNVATIAAPSVAPGAPGAPGGYGAPIGNIKDDDANWFHNTGADVPQKRWVFALAANLNGSDAVKALTLFGAKANFGAGLQDVITQGVAAGTTLDDCVRLAIMAAVLTSGTTVDTLVARILSPDFPDPTTPLTASAEEIRALIGTTDAIARILANIDGKLQDIRMRHGAFVTDMTVPRAWRGTNDPAAAIAPARSNFVLQFEKPDDAASLKHARVAVRQGLATLGIADTAHVPTRLAPCAPALASTLSHMYTGFYDPELCTKMSRDLANNEKVPPWMSVFLYPPKKPTLSQTIVRDSLIKAIMTGALGTKINGTGEVNVAGDGPDNHQRFGRDLFTEGKVRTKTGLELYTTLATEYYNEHHRMNRANLIMAIMGSSNDGAKVASRLANVQGLGNIDASRLAAMVAKPIGERMNDALVVISTDEWRNRYVQTTTPINLPDVATTFTDFFLSVLRSDRQKNMLDAFIPGLSGDMSADLLIQAAIGKGVPEGQELTQHRDTLIRLFKRLLHGGMIFDRDDARADEINEIAYKFALTAPSWFLPATSLSFANRNTGSIDVGNVYSAAVRANNQLLTEFLNDAMNHYRDDLAAIGSNSQPTDNRGQWYPVAAFDATNKVIIATHEGYYGAFPKRMSQADVFAMLALNIPLYDDKAFHDVIITALTHINTPANINIKNILTAGLILWILRQKPTAMNISNFAALNVSAPQTAAIKDKPGEIRKLLCNHLAPLAIPFQSIMTPADGPTISGLTVRSRSEYSVPGDVLSRIGNTNVTINTYDQNIASQGSDKGTKLLLDAQRMVPLIRTVHDLFLQLNMIADVHYVHHAAEQNPKLREGINESLRLYLKKLAYDHLTGVAADAAGMTKLVADNPFVRNVIFDLAYPVAQNFTKGYYPPTIAYLVNSAANDTERTPKRILSKLSQFNKRRDLGLPIGDPDKFDFDDFKRRARGMPDAPTETGRDLVVSTKPTVKHIITLKELRTASIESAPQYEGTFIVYPGDFRENASALWMELARYHAQLHNTPVPASRPDLFIARDKFESRVIPDGTHVLFASLGHILNNIVTSTDERTQMRAHMLDSAADIPPHLREKYRAQIPLFRAAFDALAHKCDFYRRVVENMDSKYFMPVNDQDLISGRVMRSYDDIGYKFATDVPSKIIGILKSIATGSSALVQDCTRALTDVGDQPRYFEVSMDSINAYRSQNNGDPIMPLSALLHVMRTTTSTSSATTSVFSNDQTMNAPVNVTTYPAVSALLPKYGFGDDAFKYQYAIRGLIHRLGKERDVAPLQTLAALDSMVNSFNKYSHGGIKIEANLAADLAQGLALGFDFLHDIHGVKRFISAYEGGVIPIDHHSNLGFLIGRRYAMPMVLPAINTGSLKATSNQLAKILTLAPTKDSLGIPTPFGLSTADVTNIISVVENRNRDDAIRYIITNTLDQKDTSGDPIIANIIDMNIMPFDLHVLARQMPLHFIWNYAFTFDTIVGSMIFDKLAPSRVMDEYFTHCRDKAPTITHARDALFAMLTDPYRTLSHDEKQLVDQVLVGALGIAGFDQPKFLSDQLLGKILLSPAPGQSEMGPRSSAYATLPTFTANNSTNTGEADIYAGILTNVCRSIGATFVWVTYETEVTDMFNKCRPALLDTDDWVSFEARMSNKPVTDAIKPLVDAKYPAAIGHTIVYIDRMIPTSIYPQIWRALRSEIEKFATNGARPRTFLSKNTLLVNAAGTQQKYIFNDYTVSPLHPDDRIITPVFGVDDYGNPLQTVAGPFSFAPLIHDMRMDTLLVRNLIHISLVLAMVQMRLTRDMTYMRNQHVVSATSALNPSIYKFFGYETQNDFGRRLNVERATKRYI